MGSVPAWWWKWTSIWYRRSLTKGRRVVNFSSLLCDGHSHDPLMRKARLECMNVCRIGEPRHYEGTRVRNQGGTSSTIPENFLAVLPAGIPGKVAPRLIRTDRKAGAAWFGALTD